MCQLLANISSIKLFSTFGASYEIRLIFLAILVYIMKKLNSQEDSIIHIYIYCFGQICGNNQFLKDT